MLNFEKDIDAIWHGVKPNPAHRQARDTKSANPVSASWMEKKIDNLGMPPKSPPWKKKDVDNRRVKIRGINFL